MTAVMAEPRRPLPFVLDDGGRAEAGFRGEAGDCVARSIAIAARLPYRQVYDELAARAAATGQPRSARNGARRQEYEPYLFDLGFVWCPTMKVGQGVTVHLAVGELPDGRVVARCSKHLVAVVNGVVHDTFDPTRHGTRAVYGYYEKVIR